MEQDLLVELDPALAGYDEARGRAAWRAVLDRLRSTPGVAAVGVASTVPFGPISDSRRVQVPGQAAGVDAQYVVIGSDYFRALGLGVSRGRDFDAAEEMGPRERTAIVSEPLARELWPDQDPVGRQIQFAPDSGEPAEPPLTVVGVAPGLRHDLGDEGPVPYVYVPFGGHYQSGMNVHVRVASGGPEPAAMLATLRDQVRAVDPRLPVLAATTLAGYRDDSIALWLVRTGARLFTLFGVVALFLAVAGVYGVKAYLVARRTREIGIRMALGATRADVVRLVLADGLRITGAGLGLGLVLALLSGQVVSGMLYQVSPADPLVLAGAPVVLAAAALLAAVVPARRATRIAPVTALRSE
jgi:predicted permease